MTEEIQYNETIDDMDLPEAPIVVFFKPFYNPVSRDGISVTVRGRDPETVANRLYQMMLTLQPLAEEMGYLVASDAFAPSTVASTPVTSTTSAPFTPPVAPVQTPQIDPALSLVDKIVVEWNNEKQKTYLAVYVQGKQYPIKSYLTPEAWTKFMEKSIAQRGLDAGWKVGTQLYPVQGDARLAVETVQHDKYVNIKRIVFA